MTTLTLPADVTFRNIASVLAQFEGPGFGATQDEHTLCIDCAALTQLDSTVVALLLDFTRRAQQQAKPISLINAPPSLRNLLHLYGLSVLIPTSA